MRRALSCILLVGAAVLSVPAAADSWVTVVSPGYIAKFPIQPAATEHKLTETADASGKTWPVKAVESTSTGKNGAACLIVAYEFPVPINADYKLADEPDKIAKVLKSAITSSKRITVASFGRRSKNLPAVEFDQSMPSIGYTFRTRLIIDRQKMYRVTAGVTAKSEPADLARCLDGLVIGADVH